MAKNLMAWLVYAVFVVAAFYFNWHPELFSFGGELGLIKGVIWLVFIAFLLFSLQCSFKENIIRSVLSMGKLYWGKQIMIDLYIGFLLSLLIIFLHQGLWVMALWTLPILVFGNLATLVYFVIHFESLVGHFLS